MQILEDELVGRIIDDALSVLAETGVEVEDAGLFDKLVALGLDGQASTRRVRFPREMVESALSQAPSKIELFDRDGERQALLEGDHVNFVPASSALRILDRETQAVRTPKSADFIEYVKLADGLPNIAYLATAFTTDDVPQVIADAWRMYMLMAYSKRPFVSGAFTSHGVPRMTKIMELFRSSRAELIEKPMAIFTCCPNTPLRWGEDPLCNIFDCAEAGVPIEIVPVLLLGMTSPATTVGALVLHTAEVLSGLTIAQLGRAGTPVIFGGAPATFHMQLMTNPMTAIEALQVYCGYGQIADRLGLPSQAYMGLSDSKFNDMQAGSESGIGSMLAALAGFNSVSGPGMLDFVNCFSLEKLVFDDELIAGIQHFLRPVEVKDDLPTADLVAELLAENHLLTSEHTLARWQEEFYMPGTMVDRTNVDQYELNGSRDFRARASEVIEDKLDAYELEPLSDDLHAEIRSIITTTTDGVEADQLPNFA